MSESCYVTPSALNWWLGNVYNRKLMLCYICTRMNYRNRKTTTKERETERVLITVTPSLINATKSPWKQSAQDKNNNNNNNSYITTKATFRGVPTPTQEVTYKLCGRT